MEMGGDTSMRKYLPTFSELIDRLCIVTLKSIKIPENKKEYEEEAKLIMNDLEELIAEKSIVLTGQMISGQGAQDIDKIEETESGH
jgi:hypothetical protein